MTSRRPLLLLLVLLALPAACEDDRRNVEHKREAERRSAANQCSQDTDCVITGCHRSLCRARLDPDFCEHRLKLAFKPLDTSPDDVAMRDAVATLIRAHLLPEERDSLSVSTLHDGLFAVFHTHPERRRAILSQLQRLEESGLYAPHPESAEITAALLERLEAGRYRLKAAQGAPALLERDIEGMDVEQARLRMNAALDPHTPEGARWVFEVLPRPEPNGAPVLRAWLIEDRPRVGLEHFQSLVLAGYRLEGMLDDVGARALTRTTMLMNEQALVLVLGHEVLAAPVISEPIRDGHIALTLHHRSPLFRERLERLRGLPEIVRALRFDPDATAEAEADFACFDREPPLAACGCNAGLCQWQESPNLQQCLEP